MDKAIILNQALVEKALLKYPLKARVETFYDRETGSRDISSYYNPIHHTWTPDERWAIKGTVLRYLEDYIDEVLKERYGL